MKISLHDARWIVVNTSGGKDSQAALAQVVQLCDAAGVSRDRIVLSHQSLGAMEWAGTIESISAQAMHFGLRLETVQYRNAAGEEPDLLSYVRKRGKWPSSKQRYCTSEYKRGPGGRVLTALSREATGTIFNVYGFRADESPARAKRKPFALNTRHSSVAKPVYDWLPIHDWSVEMVWETIAKSGMRGHFAYDLGMRRFSCPFCIFSDEGQLLIAGRHNRELLDLYCDTEVTTGHTFKQDLSLVDIRRKLDAEREVLAA